MKSIYRLSFIFATAISFPCFGLSVVCDDPREFKEYVSHKYFELHETRKFSHGSYFEIKVVAGIEESTLKAIVLSKRVGDDLEYYFELDFTPYDQNEIYASAHFVIGRDMMKGAELGAVYRDSDEPCPKVVRWRLTKL